MAQRPNYDDYEPLIHQHDSASNFDTYEKRRRKKRLILCKHRKRLFLIVSLGLIVFAGLLVGLFFLGRYINSSNDICHTYKHAAVASDVTECSAIGRKILQAGGNAVDSAIAALLCMGITDAQSMGLGGGFFMTIYNRTTRTAMVIDARETAPELANETMFEGDPDASSTGPLSIAVPGEVRGYWLAHEQFGRLPWKDLFEPAIEMAQSGFAVPRSLASAFQDSKDAILQEPSLKEAYVNPATKELYKEGETMRLPTLASTLRQIQSGGQAAFYETGDLVEAILQDLKDIGSIITRNDLYNYTALPKKPTVVTLDDGLKIFSPPPPGSGAVLSFMLNILDGYNLTAADLNGVENYTRTMHRIVETFKFAYAKRTDLGDEDFEDVTELVANLTSRKYADHIRSMITDNSTHNVSYYGPTFYNRFTTGTAHLSIVDAEGNAVAVTSTVNARFGSKRRGRKTGIVFNDEMDDFSSPNITNIFGIPPSPANFIKPGKRPLSSMCPTVIVTPDGDIRLVVGAAGGSRITTATAFVAALELWLGKSTEESVRELRPHHQLLPDFISYEEGIDKGIVKGLQNLGHQVEEVTLGKSIVQAVSRHDETLFAVSDFRKGGQPDGY